MQFTLVITSGKDGPPPKPPDHKPTKCERAKEICCSLDVWEILLNVILQDTPFFIFRLLLVTYYKLISYMTIFMTCKNTLVIILQVRLHKEPLDNALLATGFLCPTDMIAVLPST